MKCLKCNTEIEGLENYDMIGDTIECPSCKNKMTIEFDDIWEEGMDEEISYWWLEQAD